MLIDFSGRGVVVTGAGHGIGRRIAERFAEAGASVAGWGVNAEGLADLAKGISPNGYTRVVDVTDSAAVDEAAAESLERLGSVDILINNAGGVRGQTGQAIEQVTNDEWAAIVDVNLTGAFHCSRALSPGMKLRGWGRIVTISSGAGLRVSMTGIHAYAAAKAGQLGLTRQLAHELGPSGVTANAVAPGFVLSNPSTEKQWDAYGAEGQEDIIAGIARRRLGTVDDIAHTVLFLASEYADWITGQVISVDGGK